MGMKRVDAKLIGYPEADEYGASQTGGKADEVYKKRKSEPLKAAVYKQEAVVEHTSGGLVR